MEIEENKFDKNMQQLHMRIDEVLQLLKAKNRLNGETILDNQDLCLMFNLTPRSLQRYRTTGQLSFIKVGGKLFYYESVVRDFIEKKRYDKPDNRGEGEAVDR